MRVARQNIRRAEHAFGPNVIQAPKTGERFLKRGFVECRTERDFPAHVFQG